MSSETEGISPAATAKNIATEIKGTTARNQTHTGVLFCFVIETFVLELFLFPEYEDYIHAFIENNRTVDECCSKVLSTFYAYVDGEEKDEWSNHAIINGLSAAANERD